MMPRTGSLFRWLVPVVLPGLLVAMHWLAAPALACVGADCRAVAFAPQQATAYPPPPTNPYPPPATAVPPAPTAVPPAPTAVPPGPYPPPATVVPPAPTAVPPGPTAVVPRPTPVPLPNTSGSGPAGATLPVGLALLALLLAGGVMIIRKRRV